MARLSQYVYYEVTTEIGGNLDRIKVDARYDTEEERQHRAWCTMLEDERSSHCKMLKRIIAEIGVDRAKAKFERSLRFKRVI